MKCTIDYSVKRCLVVSSLLLLTASLGTKMLAAAAGADTFKAKCVICHGPDGSGSTPMGQKLKLRDLRSPDVQKQSDADLTAIISNGKPPMPAYRRTLSSEDIHELVAYIRTLAKSR